MSKFKQLEVLNLSIVSDSYEEIRVASFMETLIRLREISFLGTDMTAEQVEDFHSMNEIPVNWSSFCVGRYIDYEIIE